MLINLRYSSKHRSSVKLARSYQVMSGAQVTLAVVLLLATVVGGVDIVVDGHRRPFRSIKAPKGNNKLSIN